jgi:hypothetical protein
MRFNPFLLLAQAAALTSAFLIPPDLDSLAVPADIGAGLSLTESSLSRIVRVPCDGCKYKEADVATDLILDFNLPQGHHDRMNLNGVPVFPLEATNPALALKAYQMPSAVDTMVYMVDRENFPLVELENARLITTDVIAPDGGREYTFELSIFGVDGVPVKLEGMQMTVIEAPNGELAFGHVRAIPKGESCGPNLRCMINKMLAKLKNLKTSWKKKGGCKGRKGAHHNAVADGLGMPPPPPPPHRGHHHHHHHRPGVHHSHHGHYRGMFHRIVGQVLLPIFIGIVAGMTVSLAGLVVGHGFVMLWRRIKGAKERRRRCGGGRRRGFFCRRRMERERQRLAAAEADGEVEKGLLQEQQPEQVEAPPAYADEGLEVVEKE